MVAPLFAEGAPDATVIRSLAWQMRIDAAEGGWDESAVMDLLNAFRVGIADACR